MIEAPKEVDEAIKAGVRPVLFVEITALNEVWRYCAVKGDINKGDGEIWHGVRSLRISRCDSKYVPQFLTPLPDDVLKPKKRTLGGLRIKGHATVSFKPGLGRPRWKSWYDLAKNDDGTVDVFAQWAIPYGRNLWFPIDTFLGRIVEVLREGWEVAVKVVDMLICDPWIRKHYGVHDIASLMTKRDGSGLFSVVGADGGWLLLVRHEGREWVVGRGASETDVEDIAHSVLRRVREKEPSVHQVFKYTKREFAEKLIRGYVQISADRSFGEDGDREVRLSRGQIDDPFLAIRWSLLCRLGKMTRC